MSDCTWFTSGLNRNVWPAIRTSPASRALTPRARQSAALSASGFSTMTWQPPSIASAATSTCVLGFVATMTASIGPAASASPSVAVERASG